MPRVAILGATGSIGRQALEVMERDRERFTVCALTANRNVELLAQHADRWRPGLLSIGSTELAQDLRARLAYEPDAILHGGEGLRVAATRSQAEVVLAATDGMHALHAVADAVEAGIAIALANKELLVAAGGYLCARARQRGISILPVDSEHSALFQCLSGERIEDVATAVITASGGPFWNYTPAQLASATPEEALRHPTWVMGAKNTIDSATLMNKGLELIEASHLFGLAARQLEVVVHRQSVMHGFVLFRDGSVKAQLAAPDMRLPIAFALYYPDRAPHAIAAPATRSALGLEGRPASLSFEPVDEGRFPAVALAYRALQAGGTFAAVLSAANEEAGRAFLRGQIKFTEICALVERALDAHAPTADGLAHVEAADRWAREFTRDGIAAAAR